jgi:hypothetical protein
MALDSPSSVEAMRELMIIDIPRDWPTRAGIILDVCGGLNMRKTGWVDLISAIRSTLRPAQETNEFDTFNG